MDIKSLEERSKNMEYGSDTFKEYEAGNISEKIIICQRLQIWSKFKKCTGTSGYIHEKI